MEDKSVSVTPTHFLGKSTSHAPESKSQHTSSVVHAALGWNILLLLLTSFCLGVGGKNVV